MLEQQIEKLNTNIETLIAVIGDAALAAGTSSATPSKAVASETTAEADSPADDSPAASFTKADLRKRFNDLAAAGHRAAVKERLNGTMLDDIDPEDYASIMADLAELGND